MVNRSRAHDVCMQGDGDEVVVLGHGIGGHAGHWDGVVERLAPSCQIITFAMAGSAQADPALHSSVRHASVLGFADDIALLLDDIGVRGATFVGHSMSAMAGALAAVADPGLFGRLVMLNGSPRYVDDPAASYVGGIMQHDADQIVAAIGADYQAWVAGFAPQAVGTGNRPEFGTDFAQTLLSYDPDVTAAMFRAALASDFRDQMPRVPVPTLVVQTRDDPMVPMDTARWLVQEIPHAQLVELRSTGHFPQLVAPGELSDAIAAFISGTA